MKNAKRLKKLMRRSLIDSIARSLHRQAIAAERCCELYEQSLCQQEQSIRLSEKSVRAAQEVARIARHQYADRLLAAARQATPMGESRHD